MELCIPSPIAWQLKHEKPDEKQSKCRFPGEDIHLVFDTEGIRLF